MNREPDPVTVASVGASTSAPPPLRVSDPSCIFAPQAGSAVARAGTPAPVSRRRELVRRGLAGLLLAALLGVVGPADPPKEQPAAAGTPQEMIVFTADGPVRIRVRVTIAGRPAEDVWRAAVDAMFAHCDRNGDGILDAKERQVFQQGG